MTTRRAAHLWLGTLGAGALFAAALAGCSLLISTDDLTASTTACTGAGCTDASVPETSTTHDAAIDACTADVQTDISNCGTCGHACAAQQSCSLGACVPGCPGKIVYVSTTTGKDTNDGCSKAAPFASIGAAVTAVQTSGALGETIEVCAGDYVESGVAISVPVSLLGGFSCATWTRTPTYGYPTFDRANETTIDTSLDAASSNTVSITGATVTSAYSLDGFTINSPTESINDALSAAVELDQFTSVVVSNNVINGAGNTTSPVVGVSVQFNAIPEVAHNAITGGSSSSSTAGVSISTSSSPSLHDNNIKGGTSSGATAVGVGISKAVNLTGSRAIRGNTIEGGSGIGPSLPGSRIVSIDQTNVDLIGNVLLGGSSTCSSGSCVTYGVYMEGAGFGTTIAGNRIVGGTVSGGSTQLVVAIQLLDTSNAWIANNAVQASVPVGVSTATAVAISLVNGSGSVVQQNTAYGTSYALAVQSAKGVSIQNNLLLGQTAAVSAGFQLGDCGTGGASTFTSFTNNAFVDEGSTLSAQYEPGNCNGTDLGTIATLEGSFASGIASGNKRLASACGADSARACFTVPDCSPTQATASTCIDHALGTWDDASQGAVDLTDLTRSWALASGAPCLLTQGGGNPLVDAMAADGGAYDDSVDITGHARTPPVSIGAYENDVQCQQ